MAPAAPSKRKEPPHSIRSFGNRPTKRVKIQDARKVLTQTSDKALSSNGDLNVAAFVKAREFEIKAMAASMASSKKALTTRAFQQLPHSMRRRTASHNVKRVPKRLRARAAKEMRDDNTPTVTLRRRKATPHMRIRLEKAKRSKDLATSTKKKRADAKAKVGAAVSTKETTSNVKRLPHLKKNTLSTPHKPPAKFRKRQIHKSWLPTHVWHAKRARMTDPKDPLWRFAIPLTPTEKCYRTTHRATSARGCVAWDMSYMSTIGVEGVDNSLLGILRCVGLEEGMLTGHTGARWRRGTRSWEGWVKERDGRGRWIAPVKVVWCASDATFDGSEAGIKAAKKEKRKFLIRVHPSAFLQVWEEMLKVAKMQRPSANVEDLRFEIGSIEVSGPGSTEALIGCLQPTTLTKMREESVPAPRNAENQASTKEMVDDPTLGPEENDSDWLDEPTPSSVFSKLAPLTNPSALPPNAILTFDIDDPRLHHPPRTIKRPEESTDDSFLEIISSWPPDQITPPSSLFSRSDRLTAARLLSSQKAINRRKGAAPPGSFPAPLSTDPKIPCMLLASLPTSTPGNKTSSGQGTWTILLPWSCILPVWYSLVHYPLSTGGTPRVGGLQEKRQFTLEQQCGWFPGDFPGTRSGWAWEMREREKAKEAWSRRPKGNRTEWDSLDLGSVEKGKKRKGELGVGWGCDWERLFQGPPSAPADNEAIETAAGAGAHRVVDKTHGEPDTVSTIACTSTQDAIRPLAEPPLSIHQLTAPKLTQTPSPQPDIAPTALTPVHLNLLSSGHPSRNARIYRLPTNMPSLYARWLGLSLPTSLSTNKTTRLTANLPIHNGSMSKTANKSNRKKGNNTEDEIPQYQKNQELANRLFTPQHEAGNAKSKSSLKPNDPDYPPVPDECDLIGFVTAANFQLGQGKCEAIGNIAIARVVGCSNAEKVPANGTQQIGGVDGQAPYVKGGRRGVSSSARLCIVRDAGQSIGRLARWTFL